MERAHLTLDRSRVVGPVDRRLFGSFVEHLGRSVYDGIHEPGHPTADAAGFREDVAELVRELGVTTVRYPGGNFVSGYRWEDGVGPRDERPRRLDLAWHSTETNEVGLHEFSHWLDKVGAELMLAVNLGTRGTLEALDLLEYANVAVPTTLTERRARHGRPEPFDVRMWCLGNEMDGPWQLGHRSADDYGKLASRTAKALRQVDESLELVVCGSSSGDMPTFGEWERTVLGHTYDDVDFISCHAYYEEVDGDLASFLASAVDMDRFIESVVATIDHVKALKRSEKTVHISFDEWNVWYMRRYLAEEKIVDPHHWPVAPRLLEDVYSVSDAVVVGTLLISLLNHADRVRSASMAQLVNVIAPIMTEPGGLAWRQTTFHPFALTSRLARGTALAVDLDCGSVETSAYGAVPVLTAAACSVDEGRLTLFVANRSTADEVRLEVDLAGTAPIGAVTAQTLGDRDVRATNTADDPERVRPVTHEPAPDGDRSFTVVLPPVSWSAVTIDLAGPSA